MNCPDSAVDAPALNIKDPYEHLQSQLAGGDGLCWVWRGTRRNVEAEVRPDGTVDLRAESLPVEAVAALLRALTAPAG